MSVWYRGIRPDRTQYVVYRLVDAGFIVILSLDVISVVLFPFLICLVLPNLGTKPFFLILLHYFEEKKGLTVIRVDFDQNFVFFLFHSKTNQQFSLELKICDIESFLFQINQK